MFKINLPDGMNARDHKNVVETLKPMASDTDRLAYTGRELIDYYYDIGIDREQLREYIASVIAELVA